MWGRSDVGQLGIPKDKLIEDSNGLVSIKPQHVDYFAKIKVRQVALGEAHSLVLDNKGNIYSFGWGELGQLGIENSDPDKLIHAVPLKNCVKIAAGAVFSLALTETGGLYSWGSG